MRRGRGSDPWRGVQLLVGIRGLDAQHDVEVAAARRRQRELRDTAYAANGVDLVGGANVGSWAVFKRRREFRDMPRGFALYAPRKAASAETSGDIDEIMSRCLTLRRAVATESVALDYSAASLALVEEFLLRQKGRRTDAAGLLWVDSAAYLGTVLTRILPGARWCARAKGKPVVFVPAIGDVDVISEVLDHRHQQTPLTTLYASVLARSG